MMFIFLILASNSSLYVKWLPWSFFFGCILWVVNEYSVLRFWIMLCDCSICWWAWAYSNHSSLSSWFAVSVLETVYQMAWTKTPKMVLWEWNDVKWFSADDHENSLNQAALCQSTQVVSRFVHFKAGWSMVMAETDAGLVGKVKNEVRL